MIIDLLGRLHPAVVHFPIGILILAFILQYLSPKQISGRSELIWIVLIAGAISAAVAASLGWILSWSGEYAESAVSRHKWPGVYLCVSAISLVYLYKVRDHSKLLNTLFHAVFIASMMLLVVTAHYGANLTHGTGYLFGSEEVRGGSGEKRVTTIESEHADSAAVTKDLMLPELPAPDTAAVGRLKRLGLVVKPIAAGSNALEVNAVNVSSFGDNEVAMLSPIVDNILWLHLADTKITDKASKQISACKNLRRLVLRGTVAGRLTMADLNGLTNLVYLNIVGTSVDDDALSQYVPPTSLTHFYCWNSKVTKTGLDMFRNKYPKVIVNEGDN